MPTVQPKVIKIRQYNKMKVDHFINDLIAIDWERFQLIPKVQDAWDYLSSEFSKVVDKHVPRKKC